MRDREQVDRWAESGAPCRQPLRCAVRTGRACHRPDQGWSQDLAHALYASGCRRLDIGLESYNQRVLDLMQKGTTVDSMSENIDQLLRAGVPVHLFAISGFPGEVQEEVDRTIAFAREVMSRSKVGFANPYSTWAMSPFILDLHSPVAQNPDAFGITVIPPSPAEDLALSAGYRTTSGLDERSGIRAAAASGTGVVPGKWSGAWFHRAADVASGEEFVFLRACQDASFERRPPEAHVVVRLDAADRIRIPAQVTARVFSGDPDGATGLWLYHGRRHTVAGLAYHRGLQPLLAGSATVAQLCTDDAPLDEARIASLLRFGLLESSGPSALTGVEDTPPEAVRVDVDPFAVVFRDDDRLAVAQPIRGPVVTFNAVAAELWHGVVGGSTLAETVRRMRSLTSDAKAWEFIGHLLDAGLVVMRSLDPVPSPREPAA